MLEPYSADLASSPPRAARSGLGEVGAALHSAFGRRVALTVVTRITVVAIGLVTTIIVTRSLQPDARGLYGVAFALATMAVQVGCLGLHASNTYCVARNPKLLPALVGNSLLISLAVSAVLGAIGWGIVRTWPGWVPVPTELLLVAFAWIPFGLAYLLMQNLFLGLMKIGAYNSVELFSKAAALLIVAILALTRVGSARSFFVAGLLGVVAAALMAWRKLGPLLSSFPWPSLPLLRETLVVGLRAYLAAFFAFLVLRADLLMVKYMLGAAQAGYYSTAATMADYATLVPVVLASILFPRLSSMHNEVDRHRFAQKMTWITAGITLPITLFAMVVAGPVVKLVFGQAYGPAASAFVYLMPGIFFLGLETVLVQFLNSLGYPKSVVFAWAGMFVLNIALNLRAIPAYGIVGASVVSSLCYFAMFLLIFWMVRKSILLHPDDEPAVLATPSPSPTLLL